MFGQAKTVGVVKEMMIALEKLAVPIKLMVSLGMDGPNVTTVSAEVWISRMLKNYV